MSERKDLQPNPQMDAHHEAVHEAMLQYLKDKTAREERKEIVKEAINEWLDVKYAQVGKWTLAGIVAALLAALAYAYLVDLGWHK